MSEGNDNTKGGADELTRQVLAAGLVIAGNNALEKAARIVERCKDRDQAARDIRALKQPTAPQLGSRVYKGTRPVTDKALTRLRANYKRTHG